MTKTLRPQRGFSLIELTMVMFLAAILVAAATPYVLGSLRTYQRNGAVRHVLAKVRQAQQLAVERQAVVGLHWGGDPSISGGNPRAYRIVRDTTGSCGFPAVTAAENGVAVIEGWFDLADDFAGTRISAIRDNSSTLVGGVMFDSRGASVNTCTTANFPLTITIEDAAGETRRIEVRSAGGTRLL